MADAQTARAFRNGLSVFDKEIDAIKGKRTALRNELMEVLGIKNKVSFIHYADGKTKLDVLAADKVEAVFQKYGIQNPWGLPEANEDVN